MNISIKSICQFHSVANFYRYFIALNGCLLFLLTELPVTGLELRVRRAGELTVDLTPTPSNKYSQKTNLGFAECQYCAILFQSLNDSWVQEECSLLLCGHGDIRIHHLHTEKRAVICKARQ